MEILVCLLLHVVSVVTSASTQSNQTDSIVYCPNKICQANVSTILTIPCGGYPENGSNTFTYYNDSNDEVLRANATHYYRHYVTVYDDNTFIYCKTNNLESRYRYHLSILYSPRLLVPYKSPFGNLHYSFNVVCPFSGNPPIECSWALYDCRDNKTLRIPNETSIIDDGNNVDCIFHGNYLKAQFYDTCYQCNATNALGTNSTNLTRINFEACPGAITMTIQPIASTRKYNGTNVEIDEGEDLNITCTVTNAWRDNATIYWTYTNFNNTIVTYDDVPTEFYIDTCTFTSNLVVSDFGYNDTGTYRCIVNDTVEMGQNVSLIANVYPSGGGAGGSNGTAAIVSGAVGLLIVVFVTVIVAIVIALTVRRYKRDNRALDNQGFHLLRPESPETDYDAFISFSESDRNIAELEIKEPLERKGYKVCWHHDAFVPGCAIFDNMERSINKSRVTIILLSDAFKASDFCMTELQITVRKIQQSSKNCLIPVQLQEYCTIPMQLRDLTYINISDANLIERICRTLGRPQESDTFMNNNE